MYKKRETFTLLGKKCKATLLVLEKKDKKLLKGLFFNWKKLSLGIKKVQSRKINLPEGISEGAFSLEFDAPLIRSNDRKSVSFDAVDSKRKERLQIKATTADEDLTSFSPKSVWDKLYWLDFYRKGKLDGSFDVYEIPTNYVHKFVVNKKKNETFKDQQKQGRRPRLSIRYGIIKPKKLTPVKKCKL